MARLLVFNPFTGNFDWIDDATGGPASPSDQVVESYVPETTVSALRLVRVTASNEIVVCDPNATYEEARLHGVTLSAGTNPTPVDVLLFGPVSDASFSFTAGEPLYLSGTGTVTNTAPSVGYSVKVGYSLGGNRIQIDPLFPIKL
jgi:hypothetical protein